MRILGEINHSIFKITAFQSNGKTSIKIENPLSEHIIKFRDGSGIESFDDVKTFLNGQFLNEVEKSFKIIQEAKINSLLKMHEGEDEFDEII